MTANQSNKPLHRGEQLIAIEQCVKLAIKGQQKHLFLFGPAGSGKTFCLQHILCKYKQESIFVNCWKYSTNLAIVCKILIDLGVPVSRMGVPSDYIYEKLENLLASKRGLIVVLDNMDQFRKKHQLNDFLRFVTYFDAVSLITTVQEESILDYFDQNVIDMLLPTKVRFPPYAKQELLDILKGETGAAEDVLEHVAEFANKRGGNCRIAIECVNRIKQTGEINLKSTLTALNELK